MPFMSITLEAVGCMQHNRNTDNLYSCHHVAFRRIRTVTCNAVVTMTLHAAKPQVVCLRILRIT